MMLFEPLTGLPVFMPPIDTDLIASFFCFGFPLEFFASYSFNIDFIDDLCYSGFMPMSIQGESENIDILTPKFHLERALLYPSDIHIPATVKNQSRKYLLSFNTNFQQVLNLCIHSHGENWLRPALCSAFLSLYETSPMRRTHFVSFELYEGNDLVAGEIGYFTGLCYTSLTGFHLKNGSGTVQLAATGRLLELSGIKIWDLGMPMQYKKNLGAITVSRNFFLENFRRKRNSDFPIFNNMHYYPARKLIDRNLQ